MSKRKSSNRPQPVAQISRPGPVPSVPQEPLYPCAHCGKSFPQSDMCKHVGRTMYVGSYCRTCAKKIAAEYRARNRDKILAYQALWREENREKTRLYNRKNYYKAKEKVSNRPENNSENNSENKSKTGE